jgi:hypothetical protein
MGSDTGATAQEFLDELMVMMREAQRAGLDAVEIEAEELHRRVGGYPGRNHRMPGCCGVMREQFSQEWGGSVIREPPSGQGASLRIRYRLPRFDPIRP